MKKILSLFIILTMLVPMCFAGTLAAGLSLPYENYELTQISWTGMDSGYEDNDTSKGQYWSVGSFNVNNQTDGYTYFYKTKDISSGARSGSWAMYASVPSNPLDTAPSTPATISNLTLYHQNRSKQNVPDNDFFVYSAWVKNTGKTDVGTFMPLALKNSSNHFLFAIAATATGFKCMQWTTPSTSLTGDVASDAAYDKSGTWGAQWHKYTIAFDNASKKVYYYLDDILLTTTQASSSEVVLSGQMCGFSCFPDNIPEGGAEYAVDDVSARAYTLVMTSPALTIESNAVGGNTFTDETVTFTYKTYLCRDMLEDTGKSYTVDFYRDGSVIDTEVFSSASGIFTDTALDGEHTYSFKLMDGAAPVLASSDLTITAVTKVPTLSLSYLGSSQGSTAPVGTKIKCDFSSVYCEEILSDGNEIEIYNNSILVYSASDASGTCLLEIAEGINTFTAKLSDGITAYQSSDIVIAGVGDSKSDPGAYTYREPNKSLDLNYDTPGVREEYWYAKLDGANISIKTNDPEKGWYVSKPDVGVKSSGAAYASVPATSFGDSGTYKLESEPTFYHQNRNRDAMDIPSNDLFVYSAYVINTGKKDGSYTPLSIIDTNNKSYAEIVATSGGFKFVQYKTFGTVGSSLELTDEYINSFKDDNWHKYTICLDSNIQRALYFIDDILVAQTDCPDGELSVKGYTSGKSVFPMHLPAGFGGSEVVYGVDESMYRSYYPPFKASLHIKSDGGTAELADGSADVPYDGTNLVLQFTQAMDGASLSNIIIKENGNVIPSDGGYDEEQKTCEFMFKLKPFSTYEIDARAALTDGGLSYIGDPHFSFTTAKKPFSIESIEEQLLNNVQITLNNKPTSGKPQGFTEPVLLFAGYYDGEQLLASAAKKIQQVTSPGHTETLTLEKPAGTNLTLRVMLLEFDNLNYIDMINKN